MGFFLWERFSVKCWALRQEDECEVCKRRETWREEATRCTPHFPSNGRNIPEKPEFWGLNFISVVIVSPAFQNITLEASGKACLKKKKKSWVNRVHIKIFKDQREVSASLGCFISPVRCIRYKYSYIQNIYPVFMFSLISSWSKQESCVMYPPRRFNLHVFYRLAFSRLLWEFLLTSLFTDGRFANRSERVDS